MDKTNTPDEIVDVVDENDVIIGQATKAQVNSDPKLIHREIGVLIYDDKNRIYIQQRSYKKKFYPGWWIISVAGHIPAGMDPLAAAHMELVEELGFDTELKFYIKEKLCFPTETHFAYGYAGRFPQETVIKINRDEIEQGKFVKEQELDEMIAGGEKLEDYSLADFRKFWREGLKTYEK